MRTVVPPEHPLATALAPIRRISSESAAAASVWLIGAGGEAPEEVNAGMMGATVEAASADAEWRHVCLVVCVEAADGRALTWGRSWRLCSMKSLSTHVGSSRGALCDRSLPTPRILPPALLSFPRLTAVAAVGAAVGVLVGVPVGLLVGV